MFPPSLMSPSNPFSIYHSDLFSNIKKLYHTLNERVQRFPIALKTEVLQLMLLQTWFWFTFSMSLHDMPLTTFSHSSKHAGLHPVPIIHQTFPRPLYFPQFLHVWVLFIFQVSTKCHFFRKTFPSSLPSFILAHYLSLSGTHYILWLFPSKFIYHLSFPSESAA